MTDPRRGSADTSPEGLTGGDGRRLVVRAPETEIFLIIGAVLVIEWTARGVTLSRFMRDDRISGCPPADASRSHRLHLRPAPTRILNGNFGEPRMHPIRSNPVRAVGGGDSARRELYISTRCNINMRQWLRARWKPTRRFSPDGSDFQPPQKRPCISRFLGIRRICPLKERVF